MAKSDRKQKAARDGGQQRSGPQDGFPVKVGRDLYLFMAEAGKYNVLPLDDRGAERMDVTLRPSFFYGRRKVALPGDMVRLPEGSAPKTCNVTHTLTVSAEIPKGGADGVLVCIGGDSGGWTLFVRDGRLVYHYNWFDIERYEVTSTERLPAGEVELSLDFRNESDKPGGPASVRLFVDGKPCGDLKLPKQVPGRFSVESLDVGVDKMSPICKGYPRKQGFAFTGKIHGVTFEFEGPGAELSLEERHEQALRME